MTSLSSLLFFQATRVVMIQNAGSRECIWLLFEGIDICFLSEQQRLEMLLLWLCVCTFCAQAEVTESAVNLHDRQLKLEFLRKLDEINCSNY